MQFASARDGKVVIEEMDIPKLDNGEILVKMKACGVCGSDLEKVYGSYGMVSKRIGHEIAGEVAETKGPFEKGDRVFVHHHVPCYSCYFCNQGDFVLCPEYQKSNVEPCGLAEYIRVPAWNASKGGVIKIPGNLSYESAALAEPLACCIKAINKLGGVKSAVVVGAGPAGMMNVLLLKDRGAEVFVIDTNEFRLDFAQKLGFVGISPEEEVQKILKDVTDGRGVDAVVVATGNVKAMHQSINLVRKGGKVIIFGVPAKGAMLSVDANHIFSNEIQILTSGYCSEIETNAALKLISDKRIDVEFLITHRLPLERAAEAFELAHKGAAMKVVVTG